MLNVIYHFELNHQILNNLVCIGKYDGRNSSICFVTVGGKVMIYSPHEKTENQTQHTNYQNIDDENNINKSLKKDLSFLNINQEITAISFGLGELKSSKEYLFIGSPTSLMCYDIASNKTLFNNELLNGVYCISTGIFSKFNYPLCLVGGNFIVQGFDINGEEKFSTFAGGNAVCMGMSDFDDDTFLELIVGTDDYSIRIYKDEKSSVEINENSKIVLVQPYENTKFVFGLDNGTIGLYERGEKVWKKKQKGILNSCLCVDLNHDGIAEIICGISTGKVQIRNEQKGEILYEIELKSSIAKILLADLNNSGFDQIICCTESGEIYGYVNQQDNPAFNDNKIPTKDKNNVKEDVVKYEKLLSDRKLLTDHLESLTIQLSNKYKLNAARDENFLPASTQVKIDLQSNNEAKCADLIVDTNEGIIKCVILNSEQLYQGETFVIYPDKETKRVIAQIKNDKDMTIHLQIKVLVGVSFFAKDYQVFEYNKIIPKYCFYILVRDDVSQYKMQLQQGVSFRVNDRLDRLILWLEEQFNIPKNELALFKLTENTYDIRFLSLRTSKILQIYMQTTTIKIMSDEIELCGNVLQDLCKYFQITEYDTLFSFSTVVDELSVLIRQIEKLDNLRNQFNINMSEIITYIKEFFVRGEDNRLLDNIQSFKDYFLKINVRNMELLDEFEKRSKTYEELIADLKRVNSIIQNFSSLKGKMKYLIISLLVGSYRNKMISVCRDCIRTKNYKMLIKVVSTGSE